MCALRVTCACLLYVKVCGESIKINQESKDNQTQSKPTLKIGCKDACMLDIVVGTESNLNRNSILLYSSIYRNRNIKNRRETLKTRQADRTGQPDRTG